MTNDAREVGADFYYYPKDKLGQGAYGTVYKGWHREDKTKVAIKAMIIDPNFDFDQAILERNILTELSETNHPNLVKLIKAINEGGYVYLVMEYCNNGDLADYLRFKKTLDTETIQIFFKQIAAGLEVIHNRFIMHRDLKPQNILLTVPKNVDDLRVTDITLKIGDFGIGRYLAPDQLAASCIGSPRYMAPEICLGKKYDKKVDLWSIGVMLYECAVGDIPFMKTVVGPSADQIFDQLEEIYLPGSIPLTFPDGTSQRFQDLITSLLQVIPERRADLQYFVQHSFFDLARDTILVPPQSRPQKSSSSTIDYEEYHPTLTMKPAPKIHATSTDDFDDIPTLPDPNHPKNMDSKHRHHGVPLDSIALRRKHEAEHQKAHEQHQESSNESAQPPMSATLAAKAKPVSEKARAWEKMFGNAPPIPERPVGMRKSPVHSRNETPPSSNAVPSTPAPRLATDTAIFVPRNDGSSAQIKNEAEENAHLKSIIEDLKNELASYKIYATELENKLITIYRQDITYTKVLANNLNKQAESKQAELDEFVQKCNRH